MEWNKDPRPRFNGGYWRCKVRHAASRANYRASPKGKETARRYRESPMGQFAYMLRDMNRVRVRY